MNRSSVVAYANFGISTCPNTLPIAKMQCSLRLEDSTLRLFFVSGYFSANNNAAPFRTQACCISRLRIFTDDGIRRRDDLSLDR